MKKLLTLISFTLLTVSLTACSTKQEEPEPEQTVETEDEAKPAADDFDTQEHITVTYGDYLLDIPANYRAKEPYYYPETGKGTTAMLYLLKDDSAKIPSYEILAFGIDSYINGFLGDAEDAEVTEKYETTINGIPMYVLVIEGTLEGMTGKIRDYVFVNPSDKALMSMIFMQEETTKYDHFDDLDKIVSTIRPAE